MRKADLAALKVGDKIGIMPVGHHGIRVPWSTARVDKINGRTIAVGDMNFSRLTGYQIGHDITSPAHCLVSCDNVRRQNKAIRIERSTEALHQIRHHLAALTRGDREILRKELSDE